MSKTIRNLTVFLYSFTVIFCSLRDEKYCDIEHYLLDRIEFIFEQGNGEAVKEYFSGINLSANDKRR